MNWLLGIGILLVLIGGYFARREHAWLKSASFAEGTVVELIAVKGSKGKTNYKPRVRFTTAEGQEHEFVRSFASNPPGFRTGERVTVAYEPDTFAGRIVTFGQRFGLATWLIGVGCGLTLIGGLHYLGRQYIPAIYLP